MSDRTLSRLALIVTAAGLGLLILGMAFTVLRAPVGPLPNEPTWYNDLIVTAALSVGIVVGGLVAWRLPRNAYGWLLLLFGLSNGALQGFGENYTVYSFLVAAEPLPLARAGFILAALGFAIWFSTIPLLFLLFPTGRLPSRRWWPFAAVIGLAAAVLVGFLWRSPSAVLIPVPSPFHTADALGRFADSATSTAIVVLMLAIAVSALSVIVRALRARGQERQQFKWLGLAAVLVVVAIFFNTELVPLLPGVFDALLEAAAFAGVPLAVGIAVLRYRLWDIDVIIRKTVQYAVVTALLAVVYFVLVVTLQTVFSRVTGQTSTAAVVLSTLAIAALFTPLRRAIQGVIDRRFYRRKYNAEQVLTQFAATVRDETDLDRLTAELVRVIQETMQPEHVSVWLREVTNDERRTTSEESPASSAGRFDRSP
jgi:hypothetical protein